MKGNTCIGNIITVTTFASLKTFSRIMFVVAGEPGLREQDGDCSEWSQQVEQQLFSVLTVVSLPRWRRRAVGVDEISRVIFPLGFTVFNISYWYYYLIFIQQVS